MSIEYFQILTQVSFYGIILVSLIFCGHLGKETLDGVALASTVSIAIITCIFDIGNFKIGNYE